MNERNPLLLKYNPIEANELLYYKFIKLSIKKHTKKNYKNLDSKIKNPPQILIIPELDRENEKFTE